MRKMLELVYTLIRIGLWRFLGRASAKPTVQDYSRHLWKDSTSRLGLRMTERLRDHWRSRWLRLKNQK